MRRGVMWRGVISSLTLWNLFLKGAVVTDSKWRRFVLRKTSVEIRSSAEKLRPPRWLLLGVAMASPLSPFRRRQSSDVESTPSHGDSEIEMQCAKTKTGYGNIRKLASSADCH